MLTSNFSAENQKGPSGHQLGREVGRQGVPRFRVLLCPQLRFERQRCILTSERRVRNPKTSTSYPGGTIGGPVLIPGTRFNKSRNKLFFFTGFEYFYQVLDTGLLRATVPTASEIGREISPRRRSPAKAPSRLPADLPERSTLPPLGAVSRWVSSDQCDRP